MSTQMDDLSFSIRMRDIVQGIVKDIIDIIRPRYRYATVQAIDVPNGRCTVTFTGESSQVSVYMNVIRPSAVGQVVRVEGIGTDRFVTDVLGGAAAPTFDRVALNNPPADPSHAVRLDYMESYVAGYSDNRWVMLTGGVATVNIPSSTDAPTQIVFTATGKANTDLFTVANGALTCVRPGWYMLAGKVGVVTNSNADKGQQRFAGVYVNGVQSLANGDKQIMTGNLHSYSVIAQATPVLLAANDVVDLRFLQDTGFDQPVGLDRSMLYAQFLSSN